jgi:ATP phosphoribosyltransferase
MAQQLQAAASSRVAVPCCSTGRIARPSSSARSSSRPGSRAAARRPAPPGRLEVACSLNNSAGTTVTKPAKLEARDTLRLALPSKGRMAEDTLQLLKDCQLSVVKPNPRQYVARISQLPGLEVWFQRATDVVRKIIYGDVDLGIVGLDMLAEIGNDDPDIVILHDRLDFGQCHLALGVPMGGQFASIDNLEQLRAMPWSEQTPLRVVTGYQNIARKFFAEKGFEHVVLLSADGALEAAPAMGSADIILDLVSTGVTLRENNLKQIEGGTIMHSEGALVANRRALLERKGLLEVCHELIERLEAHLTADKFYRSSSIGGQPAVVATAGCLSGLHCC